MRICVSLDLGLNFNLFSFSNLFYYKWRAKYGMTNVGSKTTENGRELMIANYPIPLLKQHKLESF